MYRLTAAGRRELARAREGLDTLRARHDGSPGVNDRYLQELERALRRHRIPRQAPPSLPRGGGRPHRVRSGRGGGVR